MDFLRRGSGREVPLAGPSVDQLGLMEDFRNEIDRLSIEGVDSRHLTGGDMEIWNRRKRTPLNEEDLLEYYQTLKGDDMHIGLSRPNFYSYLKQNPAYRR